MDGSPLHIMRTPQFEILFMLGAEDNAETVENVDAEITLPDGTRWSATFMTLHEISRIMDRWSKTGENLGGKYFQCSDLVITREAGLPAMVGAVQGILDSGGPQGILDRLI